MGAVAALGLLGLVIVLYLRRHAQGGLDRIQKMHLGRSLEGEEVLAQPQPFTMLDLPARGTATLHQRLRLSPSKANLNAQDDRQQGAVVPNDVHTETDPEPVTGGTERRLLR